MKTLEIVNRYESVSLGARETETPAETIVRVCKNKLFSSNGYYWCYQEDYDNWKPIISLWIKKVNEHLKENPIDFATLKDLSSKDIKSMKKNSLIAYGSTLLIVLLVHDYIVCYQLGDGDIMFVSKSKKVSKPIKRDKRHIANDTSSLCLNKPEKEFRIRVFRDLNHVLEMIIVSTDGYSNSFSTEKGFLKVGTDLVEMMLVDGVGIIEENLREWIEDTSSHGSGDDTSVSIITRLEKDNSQDVEVI